MSILDIISRPAVLEGYAQGVKTFQNIENRALENQLTKIKLGQALEEMKANKLQQEQLAQKGEIYQKYLGGPSPLQQQPQEGSPQEAVGPPQLQQAAPEQLPPGEAGPPQQPEGPPQLQPPHPVDSISAPVKDVPTRALKDFDWAGLGTELLSKGFTKEGQKYLDLQQKVEEGIQKETDAERKMSVQLLEIAGGPSQQISELEDSGNLPKAKEVHDQLIQNIEANPQLMGDPKVKQFVDTYRDYRPNMGKTMYMFTNFGGKIRKQQETERHNIATETAATERNALQKANIQLKRLKENKPETFKSADANTIYRMAVGFHGGLMDEQGNIKLIDPKHSQDIQDLSELASLYFSRKKAKTHNEAISMAASDLKMKKVAAAAEAEKNKPKEEGFWSNLFGSKEEKPAETPIAAPETAPTITPGMERFAKTRNMSVEDLQAAITETAKKHNQTEDEVKKNLGIE